MQFDKFLIKPVSAQTDGNSFPTIPYVPPGGTPTPTTTVTNTPTPTTVSSPIIKLIPNSNSYTNGGTGTIDIEINTAGEEIDAFHIEIEFDPTHIQIVDEDSAVSGIQIEYIDTAFETTSDGNVVLTGQTSSSGLTGLITIDAETVSGDPGTITGRVVAKINFNVIAAKTSKLIIDKEDSTLELDSTNILDLNALQEITINSSGNVIPTDTVIPTIIPTVTETPKTALEASFLTTSVFVIGGLLLITAGVILRKNVTNQQLNEKKNSK